MLCQPSVQGTSVNVDLITWVTVQTAIVIRFRRGCHALLKLNTWNSIHLQSAGTHSGSRQSVTLSVHHQLNNRPPAQTDSVKTQTLTTQNVLREF